MQTSKRNKTPRVPQNRHSIHTWITLQNWFVCSSLCNGKLCVCLATFCLVALVHLRFIFKYSSLCLFPIDLYQIILYSGVEWWWWWWWRGTCLGSPAHSREVCVSVCASVWSDRANTGKEYIINSLNQQNHGARFANQPTMTGTPMIASLPTKTAHEQS